MLTILVLVLLAPLLIVDLVFVSEGIVGLSRKRSGSHKAASSQSVIIVPAHNEAAVIGPTLEALKAAAAESGRILVVADNCSDDTAKRARDLGVDAVLRSDPVHRGKGFALAFAREHLRAAPPETVTILDADCRTDRASLDALASAALTGGRPAQAINLLEPAPRAGPLVQLSSFAFLVKNLIRQRGLQRMAGTVHLTGTGMCLPWALFDRADLATASIVEDIRLGIELGRAGKHPLLVEDSFVWSPHAEQAHTIGQRSRWEGGFLALARAAAPALLSDAVHRGSLRSLIAALDLLVPPLALLALINGAVLLGLILLAATGLTSWLPAVVLAGVGVIAGALLILIWWREGRKFLSPGALLRLPLYMLWKVPMYLRLARSGAPSAWKRTERPGETDRGAVPPIS